MTCLISVCCLLFFFKQKTAYEMRISDWSSDVCSSDLWGYDRYQSFPYIDEVSGSSQVPDPMSVPEPSSIALFGAGLAVLGWIGSRRKIGRASCRERVCQYV